VLDDDDDDDLRTNTGEKRTVNYYFKEEALDRIKWRNRFGRGCGPVV
jgi:hypothetical protein